MTTRMRDALAQAAACRGLQNELDIVSSSAQRFRLK